VQAVGRNKSLIQFLFSVLYIYIVCKGPLNVCDESECVVRRPFDDDRLTAFDPGQPG